MPSEKYRVEVSAYVRANPTVIKYPDGKLAAHTHTSVHVGGILEVDMEALAEKLLERAVSNADGRASLADGLIKCVLSPESKAATWPLSSAERLGHVEIRPYRAGIDWELAQVRYRPEVWADGCWQPVGEPIGDFSEALHLAEQKAAELSKEVPS